MTEPKQEIKQEKSKLKSKLLKYGLDLVQEAKNNKLDPVIGRDNEIRRAIRILSRKTKNNPVLIGEPGVGKTAIAEGLAQRIVSGDVPEILKDKTIFSLDLSSVLAGAKFRGEFEERLKTILEVIQKSEGEIILFIDEIHTIVGAGKADGALDAGNMLKPLLARGQLRCIGATTLDEYRKYIEKDKALERRFQTVLVDQPNVEDTISILRGLKERFEVYHGVRIHDNAIVTASTLSERYITDRFLPDKAIDLIDEACALVKTEIDSMPAEVDNLNRKIIRMEIEQAALMKETDSASKKRLEQLQQELEESKQKFKLLKAQYDNEKAQIQQSRDLRKRLTELKLELETAERNGDLQRASEITYGILPMIEKQIEDEKAKSNSELTNQTLLREEVTDNEIAEIISKWSGIPVTKLVEGERQKLLNLESHLHKRVVGQDKAITAVSEAVIRARSGIKDPTKPIGCFLFLGTTGVGKTETAKALAESLFDSENNIIRIDMSEYMEKHSVSRLVGSPPGYVGYDEGGQLTEAVRRKPFSIILFDEVEKAHPDVFNILLQILDDGRATDNQGRTVDFKNTIIILTSNIGSETLLAETKDGVLSNQTEQKVLDQVKTKFKPEFLNRLDDTLMFKPLTLDQVKLIAKIQLQHVESRLKQMQIGLEVSDLALTAIAKASYDPAYGARPIKRYIQKKIETYLGKKIVAGDIQAESNLFLDVKDQQLKIIVKPKQKEEDNGADII